MKLTEKEIDRIKEQIGDKRYHHIKRVVQTVEKLAKIYPIDLESAKIAAWFHDIGKIKQKKQYVELLKQYKIVLDSYELENLDLAHGKLSAAMAYVDFGVKDDLILEAIKNHTTGKANMNLIEKIVYIADYIEPERKHETCEIARKLAFEGKLDESILYAMNETIKYIIQKNQILHINTIDARNNLILSRR